MQGNPVPKIFNHRVSPLGIYWIPFMAVLLVTTCLLAFVGFKLGIVFGGIVLFVLRLTYKVEPKPFQAAWSWWRYGRFYYDAGVRS